MVVFSFVVCLLRRKQFYNIRGTAFLFNLYTRNEHNSWGFALARKEDPDWDGAIEKFRKVIEINPGHANAYVNWGYVLAIKREPDYPGAIEKYKKAIELDPNNVTAYQKWGYTLAIQGDSINAARLFECANILDSGIKNYVCR